MTACPEEELAYFPPLKRGDTWRIKFAWVQEDGSAYDLSECEATLQLRDQRGRLVGEPDDIEIDPETGTVTVIFEPETTASIPLGTHYTDLQVAFLDGDIRSSQTCILPVIADQTR